MKPSAEELVALCPQVDPRVATLHAERLGEDYFATFDRRALADHLQAVARLSRENPVEVLIGPESGGRTGCTVVAYDFPAEFSLITGVLAGTGFGIESGDVFTYGPAPAPDGPARRPAHPHAPPAPPPRRCIVDHFAGTMDPRQSMAEWSREVTLRLRDALRMLELGGHVNAAWARQRVNELVAARLRTLQADRGPTLYPVQVELVNDGGPYTRLRVVAQDTPAFLYSLSNALALRGISIERVRIRTVEGRIEDEIGLLDARGRRIEDAGELDRIRFSVLLTKQFTYFLGRAPAPYAALSRFELLVRQVHDLPDVQRWLDLFSDSEALRDLARILGTSDFIWEDFVRGQYEALLPILKPRPDAAPMVFTRSALEQRLAAALKGVEGYGERCRALNAWKDREIHRVDLDHILRARADVRALAEPLTRLAETVVEHAVREAMAHLAARFGTPRTVGRLPAPVAVFGLGKFGGEALGYASDIELLFVYGDNGLTDGPEPITNAEFFSRVVDETVQIIAAKREGIFHVDIRLRPYGRSGPKACSLEGFCRYYEPGGPALSFERLALTRLRFVAADADLGRQVERLRDEFVYAARSINTGELKELREKQFHERAAGDRYNAKFSPGGLVDLEYCVQILQVLHGRDHEGLRTPRIHEALAALGRAGVVTAREAAQLTEAYEFLRRLINGLRILRGNALDLFLPEERSDEYVHLARRMGYEPNERLSPEQQLLVDFETHTATLRAFILERFGPERLPPSTHGNIADLLLSDRTPAALRSDVLGRIGFRNAARAYENLRRLAARDTGGHFARLAILIADALKRSPDADMALNNWERFAEAMPDAAGHYALLLAQPRRIEILTAILAGSQFLADTLVRNPEFLDWATNPDVLLSRRDGEQLRADLAAFAAGAADRDAWMAAIRRFHRRESLRIGTRDIGLHVPTEDTMASLSALAERLTDGSLPHVWRRLESHVQPALLAAMESSFCVLALGKLGGSELNYSSDIDLLALCDEERLGEYAPSAAVLLQKAMEGLRHTLAAHTAEGYVYRVDLRLRPHGRAGGLVPTLRALSEYYARHAALWEIQALLKARPIAGNLAVGQSFLERIRPQMLQRRDRPEVFAHIRGLRHRSIQSRGGDMDRDVKSGLGGIRDVEFLVQGLQLVNLADHPELLTGNTIEGLARLQAAGLMAADEAVGLREHYLLLRRVEHCLQVLENRQVHEIPENPDQLGPLARRVLGPDATVESFVRELRRVQEAIHAQYVRHVG